MSGPAKIRWQPIADLSDKDKALASPELRALAEVWSEQKDRLADPEPLRVFNERLQRQWAIETGVIERVYSLDRGITQLLIERGIDASLIPHDATDKDPELVAQIIRDQKDAIEGVFDFVAGRRPFGTSYIKELHAVLTRHQDTVAGQDSLGRQVEVSLLRGEYKKLPNNPTRPSGEVHEYSPPEHVAAEMDRLIALYARHQVEGVAPEVEAAWLHHRFTQIHPFQDGNGRVARALATLILIKAGWFPPVVTRDDRVRYIEGLEHADEGRLEPLTSLFVSLERKAFVNALSIAGDVLRTQSVDQVIGALKDVFERRQEDLRRDWEQVKPGANELRHRAVQRFEAVAHKLDRELGSFDRINRFFVDESGPADPRNRDQWFRVQVIVTAKALGYFANTETYRAWVRLSLRTDSSAEVLLSIHGIGHEFRGVLAASMCFYQRSQTGPGEREVTGIQATSEELFQFNYRERLEQVSGRFDRWLDENIVRALEMWRQSI